MIIPGEAPLCALLMKNGVTRVDSVPIVDALGATIKIAESMVDLRRSSGLAPARGSYFTDQPPRERVKELVQLYGMNHPGTVSFGSAETLEEAEWSRVLDINLKGTFLCCQAVIPGMRGRRYGRIINIGSILGKNGGNARPWLDRSDQAQSANVAYGASKAGVHAATLYLARELAADGITVNVVAPGPVASAMTADFPERLRDLIPVGRMGTADEVAQACLFLASRSSGFITAEILDVNGGMWGD